MNKERVTPGAMLEAGLEDLEVEADGDALAAAVRDHHREVGADLDLTTTLPQMIKAASGGPASCRLGPQESTGQDDRNPTAQRGDGTSGA